MAKVVGLFKLSGTISDLTFRQTKDGPVAQMKPGPSREKVLTSDNFRRTRLNAGEFQLAVKEATLLRRSLRTALDGVKGRTLNGRMNGLFYKAAKRDVTHELGMRRASAGGIDALTGFEFNKDLLLGHALPVGISHELDIEKGIFTLGIPAFIARKRKGFPQDATHFCIVSAGVVIDYVKGRSRNVVSRSELMPLRRKTSGRLDFEQRLGMEVGVDEVAVQVLGIQFYKMEAGEAILLEGGAMRVLEARKGIKEEKNLVGEVWVGHGEELVEAKQVRKSRKPELRQRRREVDRKRLPMVRKEMGRRLLFCRLSGDLHYICNPYVGKEGHGVTGLVAEVPGSDP